MTKINEQALRERAADLIRFHREAEQKNEWTFFVDEMYAHDAVYICEYAGTMIVRAEGIDDIKATHYGRDMLRGWEGWTFPYRGVYVGDDGKLITNWLNRGPGKRADGSYYDTPGFSILEIGTDGKISSQFDVFDLGHQMHLCDELEAVGLLSMELKENWVIPMKTRLIDLLRINM